jgi:DNA-binding LacI/PurR family transcriptional regulator
MTGLERWDFAASRMLNSKPGQLECCSTFAERSLKLSTYEATCYLIEIGHRKIAIITEPLHLTKSQERMAAFVAHWQRLACRLRLSIYRRRRLTSQVGIPRARSCYGCYLAPCHFLRQRHDRFGRSPVHM